MNRMLLPLCILGSIALCEIHGAEPGGSPTVRVAVEPAGKDRLRLSWIGGRAMYQLQTRHALDGVWQNVGEPTEATSAVVSLSDGAAFFRVVNDFTARFEVLFDSTWSPETHPGAWPANAHWSGPVGGVHNAKVHFWREGEAASEGIRLMAERGQQGTLASEIQRAIPEGNALFTMTASGLGSPDQRLIPFPKATTRDFPLLTLCSMIAPSPDWFAGVTGHPLIGADGEWIQEQTVTLYGFDAGTDSGTDFTSPDLVTSPRGVVTRFAGYPGLIDGRVVPFGTFTIRRVD